MTKIIAITNQKGGVGKTTTSVNLSSCLAYENKKTLLIDCDPQGNSTSGLGIEKDDYELSIYDCFVDSSKTKDSVIKTKYNNLYVIPSSSDLSAAEIELAYEDKREFFLKNAIDMIKENFDFIIIDSPPALGMITINIMTASDSVLIPIQCEYYALEGLRQSKRNLIRKLKLRVFSELCMTAEQIFQYRCLTKLKNTFRIRFIKPLFREMFV